VCTLLEKGVCTVELSGTELETLRTCARELRARSEESGGKDEDDGEGEGDDNDDTEGDVDDNCEDAAENDGEDDGFTRLQEAVDAGFAPVDLPYRGDAPPPVESDLLSKLSAGADSKDSTSCVYTLPAGADGLLIFSITHEDSIQPNLLARFANFHDKEQIGPK
jgi:hypothetical protein